MRNESVMDDWLRWTLDLWSELWILESSCMVSNYKGSINQCITCSLPSPEPDLWFACWIAPDRGWLIWAPPVRID
jgi:hypothetical protein